MHRHIIFLFSIVLLLAACSHKEKQSTLFEEQSPEETGITFLNKVVQSGDNNVLNYPYFFNGGGVAIGDINNDGLADVYFSGNQVANKLYLNKGNFKFEDITQSAGVAAETGWKTGVTMTDINKDGWLDIYVCRSAMSDSTLRKNLLFINNGNTTFTEKADEYGIGDTSYSTQAAFFDYDKDGDEDLFILNHSLPQFGGFSKLLANLKQKKDTRFGSKLYQNNAGKFVDVSPKAGLINNVLSFGLGIAISDLNNDGWPDLYISNDFNEEDYLYINNRNGSFENVIKESTGHVSLFSMGSEIADVNNDALPDIFTLDMLPETNERIKLSSGDDNYDKYNMLIAAGFHHQSMRNMLQLNNGNGTFSEIGQYAGISNTDWSWAPLFADFDGDGWKDLFISNGYEKDYTNMQFLKFTVDEQMKARQTGMRPDMQVILDSMPSIETGNFLYKNNGDLTFSKKSEEWGVTRSFKSNGAAYADLDNDGDLDLLINTMNENAILYKNNSVERNKTTFLKVDLLKENPKRMIIGTKVIAYVAGQVQYQEFSPVRGFQSAMYVPLTVSSNGKEIIDSVRIIWPDNKTQLILNVAVKNGWTPRHEEAKETYLYPDSVNPYFESVAALDWLHVPVDTIDFKRQLLLPKMYSYSGPKLIRGDVNQDKLEDIYVCGPKHQAGALFIQQKDGSFKPRKNAAFESDKEYQDEDALFFDADKDGDPDLYVVSGGYPFNANDVLLQDRIYMNDGKGTFTKSSRALPVETLAGSCVVALDADGDTDLDLFVGSRLVPGSYPVSPANMLLINDGQGNFKNSIDAVAPSLQNIGMITDALSIDLNKDQKMDLVLAGEWMTPKVFISKNNSFTDETEAWIPKPMHGWWNSLLAEDFDGDGDLDLMIGNYGMNNQFKVDTLHAATLVFKDFNKDGQMDPFLCYYNGSNSFPYASRDEALGQVSFLRPRFPDYISYSNATMESIFTKEELTDAEHLQADHLKTVYLENKGNRFVQHPLPIQVQFSPIYAMTVMDVDRDNDQDVIMGGNESKVRTRLGRTDANKGLLLLNDGKGNFTYVPQGKSGLNIDGDVRDMITVNRKEGALLLMGVNGRKVKAYQLTYK